MSDDFGSGDGGLGDGGGSLGIRGFANGDAHLRTVDAQGPVPYENPADHAGRPLPKIVGAIILVLFVAWVLRIVLLS